MTLTELLSGLQKISQYAGDLPVVIKDIETEAETVFHSIGLQIDPSGAANGKVTINHATTSPPAPAEPVPVEPTPADMPPAV